ncbi:hypothetical protein SG34_033570 [Thalassomonas viridans]|uniref:Uncharacterized protein n=1 Tax=Thalassomonas viridans TaxID=137584 RepID=A0AAE9ZAD6_9GAMM|nr:hypothetical protein [Thalassomonas viridans]WDE08824.1 hypothetical protein SG34_033570 [Thalassomonas viridans]
MSEASENYQPNQGIQTTQDAVEFINQQVLQPDIKPIQGTAKPMVDQAAAMMVQDMRSFIQSNEQMMTIALAKAAKLATNELTVKEGKTAIETITSAIGQLPAYATAIGSAASQIVNDFNGQDSISNAVINTANTQPGKQPESGVEESEQTRTVDTSLHKQKGFFRFFGRN